MLGEPAPQFPPALSWGFFPLTGLRMDTGNNPALRMKAPATDPAGVGYAGFSAAECLARGRGTWKVAHEFC